MVTEITGIAMAHIKWMNGCHQIGVKPAKLNKDGEPMDTLYIDIEQLEIVSGGIVEKLKEVKPSGGNKNARDLPTR